MYEPANVNPAPLPAPQEQRHFEITGGFQDQPNDVQRRRENLTYGTRSPEWEAVKAATEFINNVNNTVLETLQAQPESQPTKQVLYSDQYGMVVYEQVKGLKLMYEVPYDS